jgi:hypothetical protein
VKQQSLKDAVLADPAIAVCLASVPLEKVEHVTRPYPVVTTGRVPQALGRLKSELSWEEAHGYPWPPPYNEIPLKENYGKVVELIEARLHDVIGQVASGQYFATGMAPDGKMVVLPASYWTHPDAAVHLRGGDFLMLKGDQLRVVFRGLMIEARAKIGRPIGITYEVADDPHVQKMDRLLKTGKARSVSHAATIVAPEAPGEGTLESKRDRLRRAYKKAGF